MHKWIPSKLLHSAIAQRLARGGFWSLVGDAAARILPFASSILVARILGVSDFGAFALILSTIAMLTTIAQFGMGSTTTRYIAAYRSSEPHRLENLTSTTLKLSLISGTVAAAILFVGAEIVANQIIQVPELALPLMIVAPALMLFSLSGALNGIISGFEAFETQARLAWTNGLVSFCAIVSGVYFFGLLGAVLGVLASEIVRVLTIGLQAKRVMRDHGFNIFARGNNSEMEVLWKYSLPMVLGSMLHAPVAWVCYAMITREPEGVAQIGLYDASQKWMSLVMLVPFGASAAFAPVLSNLSGSQTTEKEGAGVFRKTTRILAAVQFFATAIPAVIVALLAPQLSLIFGSDFAAATPVIATLMILAPIFVLRHLYWQALTSGGHAWTAFWLSLLWAIVAACATWWWREDGAAGLAMAMVVAYSVGLLASFIVAETYWRKA